MERSYLEEKDKASTFKLANEQPTKKLEKLKQ
jgi:hypothetical protein